MEWSSGAKQTLHTDAAHTLPLRSYTWPSGRLAAAVTPLAVPAWLLRHPAVPGPPRFLHHRCPVTLVALVHPIPLPPMGTRPRHPSRIRPHAPTGPRTPQAQPAVLPATHAGPWSPALVWQPLHRSDHRGMPPRQPQDGRPCCNTVLFHRQWEYPHATTAGTEGGVLACEGVPWRGMRVTCNKRCLACCSPPLRKASLRCCPTSTPGGSPPALPRTPLLTPCLPLAGPPCVATGRHHMRCSPKLTSPSANMRSPALIRSPSLFERRERGASVAVLSAWTIKS